jgi:bifunctional DNA-binding transcriptional regulator/antitoxin component of YhaV-PrlF toxin-antitoxin module
MGISLISSFNSFCCFKHFESQEVFIKPLNKFYRKLSKKGGKNHMKFVVKIGAKGHIYLPKAVRQALGNEVKIIPGEHAAVLCPANGSKDKILASLQLIMQEIQQFMCAGGD